MEAFGSCVCATMCVCHNVCVPQCVCVCLVVAAPALCKWCWQTSCNEGCSNLCN
jgi:hypothetical protein